jgi:hypothetical protein
MNRHYGPWMTIGPQPIRDIGNEIQGVVLRSELPALPGIRGARGAAK